MKYRVGVVRGGPSSEYDVSLKTGAAVLEHLPREKYEPVDIFVDRSGTWHHRGRPTTPARVLSHLDCAFIAMHGSYGEDGTLQRLLAQHAVPHTGSRALASALSMNKALAKARVAQEGVRIPFGRVISSYEVTPLFAHELFRTFPQPCVVKPLASGSSVGVTVAHNFDALLDGLMHARSMSDRILVEEYIAGTEATCGVIEAFRGEDVYALPEVEIVPHSDKIFFDYSAKYDGHSDEICPGRFTREVKEELARLTKIAHRALGLRHYSRSDFIVSPRGIYFLETNTLPGLTPSSLLPKAVEAVGCTFSEFLEHVVTLALSKR